MKGNQHSEIRPYVRSAKNLRSSIVRNRLDNDFAENGGEIIYIFDTNVFIFYADLDDNNRISRDIYTLIGRPKSDALARTMERLTADFIFSGKLPGQQHNGFISVPHFEEVLNQTQRVAAKLKQGGRGLERNLTGQQEQQLQSILQSEGPTEKKLIKLGQVLPAAWLSNLNAKAHFTRALRKSFLEDGGSLIPLDRQEWGRAAANCTAADIDAWARILPPPPKKSHVSNRDDAWTLQTLVNLQRIEGHSEKRRFVFVTADSELEQAVESRVSELEISNFIRSPRDYLPIINLRSMTNALGRELNDENTNRQFEELFNKINIALDWITISSQDYVYDRNQFSDNLRNIRHSWIEASRSATVLNAYHLAEGADDIFSQVADFVDSKGGGVAASLVDRSVDELRRRHVALVLGSALADLSLLRQGQNGRRARRVGLQLIGDLFGGLTINEPINEFLDTLIGAGKLPDITWHGISVRPESYEVQLLACAIFVAAERWNAGIDFGRRAWKAARDSSSSKRAEAAYLLALCLRFSMRNSSDLDQALGLLEANLKSYGHRHETGPMPLLRRVRDKMELGNLLLTASVTQELSLTPHGRKVIRSQRLDLFKGTSSNTQFFAGVRHLVEAREELIDSQGLTPLTGMQGSDLEAISRWLRIMSATNIVGAFVFERVVPGLQLVRPAVSSCFDELDELESELKRRDHQGEPIRPTQVIYHHAARAILADNISDRRKSLFELGSMLSEIENDINKLPFSDQLEFGHLKEWLDLQMCLDGSQNEP